MNDILADGWINQFEHIAQTTKPNIWGDKSPQW